MNSKNKSRVYPKEIAGLYLERLPLPIKKEGTPEKALAEAIKYVNKTGERLVIVSTICPSYSADEDGVPDYKDLEISISPNTRRHLEHLPSANEILKSKGIDFVHIFLMADTEVDLLPFLTLLDISPDEFTQRCQKSVDNLKAQLIDLYGQDVYEQEGLPPADRFLSFFGDSLWFPRYQKFLNRLLDERENDKRGTVARSLEYDFEGRRNLITTLLGNNISREQGVKHIARQKAQYMAFASLIRDMFGKRVVVANHRTPNFAWMNDKITREPDDEEQLAKGNYHHRLPLIELDISTMPKK